MRLYVYVCVHSRDVRNTSDGRTLSGRTADVSLPRIFVFIIVMYMNTWVCIYILRLSYLGDKNKLS
jgi:hypothetical protein